MMISTDNGEKKVDMAYLGINGINLINTVLFSLLLSVEEFGFVVTSFA